MSLRTVLLLLLLLLNTRLSFAQIIAFDMDETLIQSDKLLNSDVEKAKELGFDVKKSQLGTDYIIRPGTYEILNYAKDQGFDLIVISHNVEPYLNDILNSSGLFKYFDRIISHDDLVKEINVDYELYPYHRNKTFPQWNIFQAYAHTFVNGFLVRGFQRLMGNKNIHPYLPSVNNAKYPPMYGARVLIDNASYNVDKPVDFVGIKVDEFFANDRSQLSDDWIESLKKDIDYLKNNGWVSLYKYKYGKEPVLVDIPELIIDSARDKDTTLR